MVPAARRRVHARLTRRAPGPRQRCVPRLRRRATRRTRPRSDRPRRRHGGSARRAARRTRSPAPPSHTSRDRCGEVGVCEVRIGPSTALTPLTVAAPATGRAGVRARRTCAARGFLLATVRGGTPAPARAKRLAGRGPRRCAAGGDLGGRFVRLHRCGLVLGRHGRRVTAARSSRLRLRAGLQRAYRAFRPVPRLARRRASSPPPCAAGEPRAPSPTTLPRRRRPPRRRSASSRPGRPPRCGDHLRPAERTSGSA